MFAIIETGGKQYRVQENDVLYIEKLDAEENQEIVFDKVLMVNNKVGSPYVKGAKVTAQVENTARTGKSLFSNTRPKELPQEAGHRQPYTKVKILAIEG